MCFSKQSCANQGQGYFRRQPPQERQFPHGGHSSMTFILSIAGEETEFFLNFCVKIFEKIQLYR